MNDQAISLGYTTNQQAQVNIIELALKRGNRHGLIAGATGTGKTVTMQAIAESFSKQGVPIFLIDIKGDISGISQAGKPHPKVIERLTQMQLPTNAWCGCPVTFWDVYGEQGTPLRATISDMGPLLLSQLLGLNDTQYGILTIAFAVADDQGLLLLDLKDLSAMLNHLADNANELRTRYGNVSASSVGAIQRKLLTLQRSGANAFFGEPMLDFNDLLQRNADGNGQVNVLAASQLSQEPAVYSAVLLWILSELFENLPEIGDPDKPTLVLLLDEAHLIFKDAPNVLIEKVEQVVRLIRSKGVGVYFVSQSPSDLPDSVLAQLGNRVQHALRAFTPKEQKAVKTAASTFRANPSFSAADAITELKVGEALVSTIQPDGSPSVVERVMIKPPLSQIGAASTAERNQLVNASTLNAKYNTPLDRESAFEMLTARAEKAANNTAKEQSQSKTKPTQRSSNRQSVGEALTKSIARSIGSSIGRSLVRGVLGSLFKGR